VAADELPVGNGHWLVLTPNCVQTLSGLSHSVSLSQAKTTPEPVLTI